jgi:hypothetical protein
VAQRRWGGVSVSQPVTVRSLESAKCWSEWQDFDPPRPELVPNEVRYQTTLHSGSLEGAPPSSTRDPQRPDSRAGFALSVATAQSFQHFIEPIFLSALQADRPLIDVGEPTIEEIRF